MRGTDTKFDLLKRSSPVPVNRTVPSAVDSEPFLLPSIQNRPSLSPSPISQRRYPILANEEAVEVTLVGKPDVLGNDRN